MKIRSVLLSLLSLALLALTACNTENNQPLATYVSGQYLDQKEPVTIYMRDYGNELGYSTPIYIDSVTTDEDGRFSFKFSIDHGKEIALTSDFDFNLLFVEPGDSIYFETDGDYKTPLQAISGKGSNKLSLMESVDSQLSFLEFIKIDSANIMPAYHKRLDEYNHLLDSIKTRYSEEYNQYMQAGEIQAKYYFLNVFPMYVKAYKHEVFPKDTVAADSAKQEMLAYADQGLSNFNFVRQLFSILITKSHEADSASVTAQITKYRQFVEALKLQPAGTQQLLGLGYLHFLERGYVAEVEPNLQSFYKKYPHSIYKNTLSTEYEGWYALSKGQPAPDIIATATDSSTFKVSDLQGKVVYVDIWATWCGPCLQEMPYSREIKAHYKGNDNIAFLYVSVDANRQKWLTYLEEHPDFTGIQVNDPGNFEAKIAKAYKVQGIPRYMIIDKEGNIFATDAKRPSDKERLIAQLDEALSL